MKKSDGEVKFELYDMFSQVGWQERRSTMSMEGVGVLMVRPDYHYCIMFVNYNFL